MVDEGARIVSQLEGDGAPTGTEDVVATDKPAITSRTNGDLAAGPSKISVNVDSSVAYPSNNPFASPVYHKPAFETKVYKK